MSHYTHKIEYRKYVPECDRNDSKAYYLFVPIWLQGKTMLYANNKNKLSI